MSGCEWASQSLRRHVRRCMTAVGASSSGVFDRSRSRIGRAAISIGLLITLRVVGEGRREHSGAEHQRSGGSEGYGSVTKHGGLSFLVDVGRSRHVTAIEQENTYHSRLCPRGMSHAPHFAACANSRGRLEQALSRCATSGLAPLGDDHECSGGSKLQHSSDNAALDEMALATVQKAGPFPPPAKVLNVADRLPRPSEHCADTKLGLPSTIAALTETPALGSIEGHGSFGGGTPARQKA